MTTQAAAIAETVMAMRKALSGHQYSSDSDDVYLKPTNRGNKLKRKAQYVREGRLDLANGPKTYKRKIEHAGHERYILRRNPKRYDEDGDELEDEDEDEDADADALRRNPLGEVKLENLLAPLTSAPGLADHPSLSVPYESKILTDLARQACDMVHKEKRTLWNVKHLLAKFRGDQCWAPGELFLTEYDEALFSINQPINLEVPTEQEILFATNGQNLTNGTEPKQPLGDPLPFAEHENESIIREPQDVSHTAVEKNSGLGIHVSPEDDRVLNDISTSEDVPIQPAQNALRGATQAAQEVTLEVKTEISIQDAGLTDPPQQLDSHTMAEETLAAQTEDTLKDQNDSGPITAEALGTYATETQTNGPDLDQPTNEPPSHQSPASGPQDQEAQPPNTVANSNSPEDSESRPHPHRMRTRAQAQATTPIPTSSPPRSPSPTTSIPPFIHPLFLIPPSAIPSRDFGLPSSEAEDTRRILNLYVQKQEEVCRGVEKLYEGLLKADRMRKEVMKWCKAEGHVGEMSDGEDWYDRAEWGLEEELRKGQAEEEDEEERRGKKTRRRAQ